MVSVMTKTLIGKTEFPHINVSVILESWRQFAEENLKFFYCSPVASIKIKNVSP